MQIFEQILQILRNIYEEKNLKIIHDERCIALKQKRDDVFVIFFSKFRKLSSILQYFKIMLIDNFKNKILFRFRKALIIRQIRYILLLNMRVYL